MICKTCVKEGKEVMVFEIGARPFWVHDQFHDHDTPSGNVSFRCSSGHEWSCDTHARPCPTCGFEWIGHDIMVVGG